jgi:hypothetical protein
LSIPAIRTARQQNKAIPEAFPEKASGSTFAERITGPEQRMDDLQDTQANRLRDLRSRSRRVDPLAFDERDRDLWCLVFEAASGFFLVVEDHPEGTQPPRLSERHADVIALVSRSDALKDDYLQDGWSDVDVD